MEPKKDDPETISGPSDRSIENVVFLLDCPFYGAQFKREGLRFFVLNCFPRTSIAPLQFVAEFSLKAISSEQNASLVLLSEYKKEEKKKDFL